MSKGIGSFQLKVLEAIFEQQQESQEVVLWYIKYKLFGRVGGGYVNVRGHGEVKIKGRFNCNPSQAANLNRALASLKERGLITEVQRRPFDTIRRFFIVTDKGISEYKSKVFTYNQEV